MKKNLLPLFAAVCAIILSSFTVKRTVNVYMVYNGGTEKSFANYSQQLTSPGTISNVGTITLAWARFTDDDGVVLDTEFDSEFDAIDVANPNSDLLSDETEDHVIIEKQ